MSFRNLFLFFSILLFFSISLESCQENKKNEEITAKKTFDAETTWLLDAQHFSDSTYDARLSEKLMNISHQNSIEKEYDFLHAMGNQYTSQYYSNDVYNNHVKNFISKSGKDITPLQKIELQYILGSNLVTQNQIKEAKNVLESISFVPQNKDEKRLAADIHYELGYTLSSVGNHVDALKKYKIAEKYYTEIKDEVGLGVVKVDLGYIHMQMNEYDKAEKFFYQAQKIFNKNKDSVSAYNNYINIVLMYTNKDDSLKILRSIDTLEILYQKHQTNNLENDLYVKSYIAYKNIANNKLEKAKKQLDELFPLFQKHPETDPYLLALSKYVQKTKQPLSDSKYFHDVIPIIKEKGDFIALSSLYEMLETDALVRKDYKDAYQQRLSYQMIGDSINSIKTKKIYRDLDNKYQLEKKEKIISQKNRQLILVSSLLVALTLLYIIYRIRKKLNHLKMKRNAELEYSKKLYNNTEEERKRIASELHDGISHELLTLKNSLSQDISSFHQKIDVIINEIRNISRNLHPIMFDKIGLNETLRQMTDRIRQDGIFILNFESNYSGFLDSQEELHIYRIIQEAISNIIKYSKAHAAMITLDENENELIITIKDNGIGFPVEEMLNSKKTFGLQTIIQRSKTIDAEPHIESGEKGTTITITKKK